MPKQAKNPRPPMPIPNDQERLYRLGHVEAVTGHRRSTIYQWIQSGSFPKQRKIGASSAWLKSDVDRWLASQVAQ
jgi:prophage regulatory protein